MKNLEHQHAKSLMIWWSLFSKSFDLDSRLLVAIPNGGHRHIGQAIKLKKEGVTPGVPDYFLFLSRGGFNGLALELKHEKGRVSPAQKQFMELIEKQGYKTFVAYGWDAAREAIENYIKFGRVYNASN